MKKLIFILVFIPCISFSQNLVINGSAENFSICMSIISDTALSNVTGWYSPNEASPDYCNPCSTPNNFGMPKNIFGYQYARTGLTYADFGAYAGNEIDTAFYIEYIGLSLSQNLIQNKSYNISAYISNAGTLLYDTNLNTLHYSSIDSIGFLFEDTIIKYNTQALIHQTPQVYDTSGFNMDTTIWKEITGTYVATGNEHNIIIGNFNIRNNNDIMTSTYLFPATLRMAVYYIDDIAVWPADTIPPISMAGNDTLICYGDTISLGSHNYNDYDYIWFTKNQTAINNAPFIEKFNIQHLLLNGFAPYKKQLNFISNIGIISQTPLVTTTYYCLATDFRFEKTLDSITVYVKKCGTNAGMDTTVCKESQLILGDSSNIGFQCQWQPSTYLSSDTVPMPQMSCMSSMTYYLTVYSGSVIIKTDSIKVIVVDCYYAEAGIDTTLCLGDSIQLGSHNHSSCTYVWWPNQWLSDSTIGMPFAKPDTLIKYFLQVIDTLGNVSVDSILIGVVDCDTVGIDEARLNIQEIKVHPNPTTGQLNIEIPNELNGVGRIIIRNVLGKTVYNKQISQGINSLNLESLDNSIYIYSIYDNTTIISTGKFILNK